MIDALQIVKKEQNELIDILDQEERQIEEELKECKSFEKRRCSRMISLRLI